MELFEREMQQALEKSKFVHSDKPAIHRLLSVHGFTHLQWKHAVDSDRGRKKSLI
jgi:hypothetical protein